MCRSSPRISPQVRPAVGPGMIRVPQTTTPCAVAASRSIAAFAIPVVTSSRKRGSRASRSAPNGVRSRIATSTSNGASRSASRSAPSTWSVKTVTSASRSSHGA